jgi:hypothetical protein
LRGASAFGANRHALIHRPVFAKATAWQACKIDILVLLLRLTP